MSARCRHAAGKATVPFGLVFVDRGCPIEIGTMNDGTRSLDRYAINDSILLLDTEVSRYALCKRARRLIPGCGDVSQIDTTQSALFGYFAKSTQDSMLYASSKRSTAQQQSIHSEHICTFIQDHQSHDAVVAEAIANLYAQHGGTAAGQCTNLGFSASDRREIELVRSLCELCRPRPLTVFRHSYVDFHTERCDEAGYIIG